MCLWFCLPPPLSLSLSLSLCAIPSQVLVKTCADAKAKGGLGPCEFCAGSNMANLKAANCTNADIDLYCNSTDVY